MQHYLKFHCHQTIQLTGLPVKIYVYAQNSKGTSEPFIIEETFAKHSKHSVEGRKKFQSFVSFDFINLFQSVKILVCIHVFLKMRKRT
jgi:hypothetical protein